MVEHLLDIAGGSGIYACSLVTHHPHLAATVFEKSPVDRIAARAIANRGCSGTVSVVAGDMLAGIYLQMCETKPPVQRETVESWTPSGSSFDPRVAIIKDSPGPLLIAEIALEITL